MIIVTGAESGRPDRQGVTPRGIVCQHGFETADERLVPGSAFEVEGSRAVTSYLVHHCYTEYRGLRDSAVTALGG